MPGYGSSLGRSISPGSLGSRPGSSMGSFSTAPHMYSAPSMGSLGGARSFGGGMSSSLGGSTVAERNLTRITVAVSILWVASIVGIGLLIRFA